MDRKAYIQGLKNERGFVVVQNPDSPRLAAIDAELARFEDKPAPTTRKRETA